MISVNEFCERMKESPKESYKGSRGNMIYCVHMRADRYKIDFAESFSVEEWEQYDTSQDAPYFGVWVNKVTMQILTYCEGDWELTDCPDAKHFNREIEVLNAAYSAGFICIAHGKKSSVRYVQDRSQFLVGEES